MVTRRGTVVGLQLVLVGLAAACREDVTTNLKPTPRVRLVRRAIEMSAEGDVSAQVYLGWVYATGSGVLRDRELAEKNLTAASREGSRFAGRLLKIVGDKSAVEGLEKCVAEVRRSAQIGDADAQFIQAIWMLFGEGLRQNPREGRRLVSIAAERGNTLAKAVRQMLFKENPGQTGSPAEVIR